MKAFIFLCVAAFATASPLANRQAAASSGAATTTVASPSVSSVVAFPSAAATDAVDPFEDFMDAVDFQPVIAPVPLTIGGGVGTSLLNYDPDEAAAEAASTILDTVDDEVDLVDSSDTYNGTSDSGLEKRGSCAPQSLGNYPYGNYSAVSPDTTDAFLANPAFSSLALNAVTPPGYFLVDGFHNLQASARKASQITYISSPLKSYNVQQCADWCINRPGCVSFDIFFERDPSLAVDSTNCPNPPSYTRIKCVFFTTPIIASDASNSIQGGHNGFETVIAGANAYTTTPQDIPGFTGPVAINNATIVSPTSEGTYIGVYTYPPTQPYDPNICATVCNSVSAYNTRHPSANGPRICRFFDAFMAYKNGLNGVLTCTLYTKAYDPSYATNFGQTRSGNFYGMGHSYTYTLNESEEN